jgi:L-lactate utilization protein LutC
MPAFTGWGYSKDFPKFAGKTFRERWTGIQNSHVTLSDSEGSLLHKQETLRSQQPLSHNAPLPFRESDMDTVNQFIESLIKVDGKIIRATEKDITHKVIEFLRLNRVNHIHLEPNILDEVSLRNANISITQERDAGITVGVTKALCGLADTGSVLEADGAGDKLFASLLPEIHLIILRESEMYPSLEDAIHLVRGTKSAAFITGPSRTGDIEMSHTIGVHGPGEVVVFLVT